MDLSTSARWVIVGCAIVPATSPSDVAIVPSTLLLEARPAGAAEWVDVGIAIARVNQPALTIWLRDAINGVLHELPLNQPRPRGRLIERGAFFDEATEVFARNWFGSGRKVKVVRCSDADTARQLVEHLNALLATE